MAFRIRKGKVKALQQDDDGGVQMHGPDHDPDPDSHLAHERRQEEGARVQLDSGHRTRGDESDTTVGYLSELELAPRRAQREEKKHDERDVQDAPGAQPREDEQKICCPCSNCFPLLRLFISISIFLYIPDPKRRAYTHSPTLPPTSGPSRGQLCQQENAVAGPS